MMPDKSPLPGEAEKLPVLNINRDLDVEELYTVVKGTQCRRCGGTGIDPDGEYSCLLCRGMKVERFPYGSIRVCSKHPDKELVNIGRRAVTWEDGQGFDHSGFLAVRGCPVCRVPAYSVMFS